jgi:hypothetical protein
VSALVGAGGNAGAVFAGFAFYKQNWDDTLTPFKLHALYVIVTALMNPFYSWPHLGNMWSAATITEADGKESEGESTQSTAADSATGTVPTARV